MHQQLAHRVKTVGAGDLVKALLNLALRLRGFDFDVLRRLQKRLRQLLNALGVGGREQQGLALFGRLLDDFADVVKKAHVQHAVGLVEHQGVQAFKRQVATLQVVHDAAGRAHHNVGAVFQRGALAAQRNAAAQGDHLHVILRARQAPDFHRHLVGQLARGAQHHGLHRKPAGVEFGQERQGKGSGFAAAGFGLGDQVLPGQRGGQAGGLDGRHFQVAQLLQIGQRGRGQRQGRKGVGCGGVCSCSSHTPIIGRRSGNAPGRAYLPLMASSSTSNSSVALGGITPPAPRAP